MGKYTVYDLRDGKTLVFENRRQLTQWWLRANPVGVIHWHQSMNREELFTELNLNGNDMRRARMLKTDANGSLFSAYWGKLVLRRYVVRDEAGRIVDIRSWPLSNWEEPAGKCSDVPNFNGWKRHSHRRAGRAMELSVMRESSRECLDEDDEFGVYMVPPVRRKAAHAASKRRASGPDLGSWKNTRCKKQYQRHSGKHGDCGASLKRVIASDWLEPTEEPVAPDWFEPFEEEAA